jgi:cell wall-associated NlpC family hydrolase
VFAAAGPPAPPRLAVVGRSSAVLAASTGLIATVGLPTQAYAADSASGPVTSTSTGIAFTATGIDLLSSRPGLLSGAPLSAPTTASVAFESDAFTAVPTVARHAVSHHPATRHAPARSAVAPKQATPPAAKAKPAPVKKAAPAAKAPAAKAPANTHKPTATPKRSRHAATPVKSTRTSTKRSTAPKPKSAPKPRSSAKPKSTSAAKSTPAGSVRGSSVLAIAARYLGTPYLYGGTTPHGFDCSGYTRYVYHQLGKSLPRTANEQMQATHRISRAQARPGDLVFFVSGSRAYHVGIYAGGGMMYDAPHTGARVGKRAIWDAAVVFGRVTG